MLKTIQKQLKEQAEKSVRLSSLRFFKEDIKIYGVKAAQVRQLARSLLKEMNGCSKTDVFAVCEQLWKSGYLEETAIACYFAERLANEFVPDDFATLEHWTDQYISNWAACDSFCTHSVGTFLEMYPSFVPEMKNWARSDNFWKRRAGAVSLIVPAKKGLFHKTVYEIARILLTDSEDMVQKGYGWLLKVTSQADQESVYQFVLKHKTKMPRTALRYAIEKMPNELKVNAMKK